MMVWALSSNDKKRDIKKKRVMGLACLSKEKRIEIARKGGLKGLDEQTFEFIPSIVIKIEDLEAKNMSLNDYTDTHVAYLKQTAKDANVTSFVISEPRSVMLGSF